MADYWLGVLTPFLAVAAVGLGLLALRALFKAAEFTTARYANESKERRALLGAVAFSAKRVWLIAAGDFSIAVFAGQHEGERQAAYRALNPPRTLKRITDEEY